MSRDGVFGTPVYFCLYLCRMISLRLGQALCALARANYRGKTWIQKGVQISVETRVEVGTTRY